MDYERRVYEDLACSQFCVDLREILINCINNTCCAPDLELIIMVLVNIRLVNLTIE